MEPAESEPEAKKWAAGAGAVWVIFSVVERETKRSMHAWSWVGGVPIKLIYI